MKKAISYFKISILLNFLLICLCAFLGANKSVNAVCTQDSDGGQCVAYVRDYYGGSYQKMPGLCQYEPIHCGALNAWGHWDLGFRSGQIPAKDSIMVLDQWSGVPTGHMAVVTDVRNNCDGTYTLTVDESNWDLDEKVDCNVTYTFFKNDSEVTRENGATKYSAIGFIHGSYLSLISKGLEYLRCQQQANGSWQNHVGFTAMSTLAFLNAGYTEDNGVVFDGIQYLLSYADLHGDGGIYNWYGNYETSLSILALKATGNSDYDDEIANAADYLKTIQSDDIDDSDHSWYGGWGYAAWDKNNWSDLSNSQFSAMALDAAGVPKNDMVWTRFLSFLSRTQNLNDINDMPWADGRTDGGFTYNPAWNIWNNFNSYGSMTTAGLWGLRLSGVPVADDRVQSALGWLEANEGLNFNSNPMWGNSNRYYYYMAFSKAMAMCFLSQKDTGTWYEGWYDALRSKIASEQEDEGFWNQDNQGQFVDTIWALLTLQTQQSLPANLWMSIILASPANLLVYDSQERVCSENECDIPGAKFETDANGRQIVNLTELEPGHYRFVFIGTGTGTCHLTVNGHRDDEIISTETKEFEIRNNEVLRSDVLVSSLVGALTIIVEDPEPPPFIPVAIDIKPQSCPNPLNAKSKGVLPLVILGSEDFDVTQVDPTSVLLEGVSPLRWALEDVATPFEPFQGKEDCFEDCNDFGPDGYMDLTVKFNTKEVVAALGVVNDGDCMVLTLTGNLIEESNGTPIVGEDIVLILNKK